MRTNSREKLIIARALEFYQAYRASELDREKKKRRPDVNSIQLQEMILREIRTLRDKVEKQYESRDKKRVGESPAER